MPSDRLSDISFYFPRHASATLEFFETLVTLLKGIPTAHKTANRLVFTPSNPAQAWPVTSIDVADVAVPTIVLPINQPIDVEIGHLRLSNTLQSATDIPILSENASDDQLTLADLNHKLRGHVTRIDHTGINLPSHALSQEHWTDILKKVAAESTLYRYPTGEDWPFIIPSTDEEYNSDIQDFVLGREPKFELVYDHFAKYPEIQIALGTDLTKQALETLFPAPYGIVFPELEEIFRVVHISHPWPSLNIRFDLYYADKRGYSPWSTGEWLIVEGGRII
ncbi:MAG: hypothetical protein AAF485_25465 [Chloroflexota bacterium]